jgi:hypothetical protein
MRPSLGDRHIRRKLALAIALGTLLALTVWRASSPEPRPLGKLTIGFDGFMNYQGNRVGVVDLTNHYGVTVHFLVAIERKTTNGWPNYAWGIFPHSPPTRIEQDSEIEAGGTYRLLAIVPAEQDYSAWRVSVGYVLVKPLGKISSVRQKASTVADDAGLPWLAEQVRPRMPVFFVNGPEIGTLTNAAR